MYTRSPSHHVPSHHYLDDDQRLSLVSADSLDTVGRYSQKLEARNLGQVRLEHPMAKILLTVYQLQRFEDRDSCVDSQHQKESRNGYTSNGNNQIPHLIGATSRHCHIRTWWDLSWSHSWKLKIKVHGVCPRRHLQSRWYQSRHLQGSTKNFTQEC